MNKLWKMLPLLCIALCLLTTTSIPQASASNEVPTGLTANGAVLIDMKTGQVLFEHKKDEHLYPASITKVMTCILALEKGDLNAMVKTSKLAREQEGNRVYLEYDEQQPLGKLLYGLMLNSGNDAAVAIAEHIGSSVEGFAKMMNDKAQELGATNTHFVTPSGLHEDNHYTSPYDMALISTYAMKNPKFREIVQTQYFQWDGQEWHTNLVNINPMLWNYDGATGIKTGFTDQAMQTMVASAKRGDREVLAVVMGVQDRRAIRLETTALLDYGFDQFMMHKVGNSGDTLLSTEQEGRKIDGILPQDVFYTVPINQTPNVKQEVKSTELPPAFLKGSKVGTVTYSVDGQAFATVNLVAEHDVLPPPTPVEKVSTWSEGKWIYLLSALAILLVVVWFLRRLRRIRNKQPLNSRSY